MSIEKASHPSKPAKAPVHVENSTDATRGSPLALRAQTRKAELAKLLAELPADEQRLRDDIERSLASIDQQLTGDVEHMSTSTASEVSRWLEATKHLGEAAATKTKTARH